MQLILGIELLNIMLFKIMFQLLALNIVGIYRRKFYNFICTGIKSVMMLRIETWRL
jgi:hypothetical protein